MNIINTIRAKNYQNEFLLHNKIIGFSKKNGKLHLAITLHVKTVWIFFSSAVWKS